MSRIIRFCLVGVENLSPVKPRYVPAAVAGRLMKMVRKQKVEKLMSPKRALERSASNQSTVLQNVKRKDG